jgi:2-dehydro-3-deoxy-D-arabinonate dehydratase
MTIQKLHNTRRGVVLEREGRFGLLPGLSIDALLAKDDLARFLASCAVGAADASSAPSDLTAPIGSQEVWAAGVTYYRSRDARMEEAETAGGGSFYDRVYTAPRPELFFKALAHRVAGPRSPVRIRSDSRWNVPEPELTLVVSPRGRILGYTIGNDMSSRDIEGENPLYLPQAKVYDGSCALGPAILVTDAPLPKETSIRLEIDRAGKRAFEGATTLASLKRSPQELVDYLFRDNSFPAGCFLLTGTGIVPPSDFTLSSGDEIRISIDGIGTLENAVA